MRAMRQRDCPGNDKQRRMDTPIPPSATRNDQIRVRSDPQPSTGGPSPPDPRPSASKISPGWTTY